MSRPELHHRRPGSSSLVLFFLLPTSFLPWPTAAEPFAYVALRDANAVAVIDTVSNTAVSTISVGSEPSQVTASPDGSRVYIANLGSDSVSVIDTASGTVVATISVGQRPWGIDIAPDGRHVYVANFDAGNISVIDTASNNTVATVPVGAQPSGVAVSADSSRVWVSHRDLPFITIIDAATLEVIKLALDDLPNGTPMPAELALSTDGDRVFVTAYYDGTASVLVIDVASGSVTDVIQVGGHYAQGIVMAPDGRHACVAAESGIYLLDLETFTLETPGTFDIDDAFEVAYSPDGGRIFGTYFNDVDDVVYLAVIDTASHTLLTEIPLPGFGLGVAVAPVAALQVEIDIKPPRVVAKFSPDNNGSMLAVIFGSADFSPPDMVDPASLQLSGSEVRSVGKRQKILCHDEDVNSDGFSDLLCQFSVRELRLEPGAEKILLTGSLYPEYGATHIKGEYMIQHGIRGAVRNTQM